MKKLFKIGAVMIISGLIISLVSFAQTTVKRGKVSFGRPGEHGLALEITVSDFSYKDDTIQDTGLRFSAPEPDDILFSQMETEDEIFAFTLSADDDADPYPSINPSVVSLEPPLKGGGRQTLLGKDYRLYFVENNALLSTNITDSSVKKVTFGIEKLGTYVLVFNPAVYDVTFYDGYPILDENDQPIAEVVHQVTNLKLEDSIVFPSTLPQKEGMIFTGWKRIQGSRLQFVAAENLTAGDCGQLFAQWTDAETYQPLTITLDAPEAISKGDEDGKHIILTVSDGSFGDFPSDWKQNYDTETAEANREELMKEWNSIWQITGEPGIIVGQAEKADDHTVRLTLSGNSRDASVSSEIGVSFASCLLETETPRISNTGIVLPMYSSDNTVPLRQQGSTSHSGSNAGSGSSLAVPKADIPSGSVAANTRVTLTASSSNIKIYYTTDGTTPSSSDHLYTTPIVIDRDMTLKYIAVLGLRTSPVGSSVYTITSPTPETGWRTGHSSIRYMEASNDRFRPDTPITRYETLDALARLYIIAPTATKLPFGDVSEAQADTVALFYGAGLIQGYPDNTFGGTKGLTRAELVTMLNQMDIPVSRSGKAQSFADLENHWAKDTIEKLSAMNLVKGYEDGTFRPDDLITRAEFATLLNRIVQNSNAASSKKLTDVGADYWARQEILKAVMD